MTIVLTVVLSGGVRAPASVLLKAVPFTQYAPCGKSKHPSHVGDTSGQAYQILLEMSRV